MRAAVVIALFGAVAVATAMPIADELVKPTHRHTGRAHSDMPATRQPQPLGWGKDGHDITASLAQLMLGPAAMQACANLLPSNNGQLVQIANWADQVKSKPAYRWSAPLHFINTPDWACTYYRSRDCVLNGVPNFCVDGAIQNYTKRVVDQNLPFEQQQEALKFLVHFVGDIHQPLHVAFTSDKGGNTITGTFEGQSYNLHAVWDEGIILKRMSDDFGGSQTAYMQYLSTQINTTWAGDQAKWVSCQSGELACSDEWAVQTLDFACSNAYVEADGKTHITSGFNLGDPYYDRNYPVVDLQLAKAGVRMAHVLNKLFESY